MQANVTKNKSIRAKISASLMTVTIITMVCITILTAFGIIFLRAKNEEILMNQAISGAVSIADRSAENINEQLISMESILTSAADYTEYVYNHPENFAKVHNNLAWEVPKEETGVTFHWGPFNDGDELDEAVIEEADMLSALEPQFHAAFETQPMLVSMYVATKTHINIGYDENAHLKGAYSPIDSGASWYLKPIENGEFYVSDAYGDVYGRGLTVTMSAPYSYNGEIRGVVGADVSIDSINKNVLELDTGSEGGYAILLTSQGDLIATKGMTEEMTAADVLGSNSQAIITNLAGNIDGVEQSKVNGNDVYIVYSTIESTGWKLAIVLPKESVIAPVNQTNVIILRTSIVVFIFDILILIFVLLVAKRFSTNLTKPILQLTEETGRIGSGNLDYVSTISSGDEIEKLGHKFEDMTVSLKNYIDELTSVTAERERIGAELDVATHIQSSMLPCIFPPFPHRHEVDIYASMTPAKEVGGDFYDFFMVDDRHVAIVMADVSGKGVPAALFMVIGKTLIKDHTVPGRDLGQVFKEVNNILCNSNSEGMFITAFEGVLDLVSGEFVYVNAGHETPYICNVGEEFEQHKVRAGFVLAGMEGINYRCASTVIEPGAKILLYTDGVPEATNASNELFGMERLDETVKGLSKATPKEVLDKIQASVDEFVGDAPQFDDLTMLCLEFKERMEE